MSLPESNPYQFIPFPSQVPRYAIPRFAGHDRQSSILLSGTLKCTIHQEEETPIMAVTRLGEGAPQILPSSSLRGMIRSVVEIAGQGCGSFIGGKNLVFEDTKGQGPGRPKIVHRIRGSRFPADVQGPCQEEKENRKILDLEEAGEKAPDIRLLKVCRACALFGFAFDRASWRGRVRFSHADCAGAFEAYRPEKYSPPDIKLRSPMPHHQDFYFVRNTYTPGSSGTDTDGAILLDGGVLAGRKVYQHENKPGRVLPDKVAWVADVSRSFRFDVAFENLMVPELGLLIFALDLDRPNSGVQLRHHYGYGKPAGFGTVRIEVQLFWQKLESTQKWYTSYDADEDLKTVPPTKLKQEFFKERPTTGPDWAAFEKWLAWPQSRAIRYPTQAELKRGRP